MDEKLNTVARITYYFLTYQMGTRFNMNFFTFIWARDNFQDCLMKICSFVGW